MNSARIAAALNTISLAFGELAEALTDTPASLPASATGTGAAPRGVAPSAPPEPSPFEDEAVTWEAPDTMPAEPQGSLEMCPKHHVAYRDGTKGTRYCSKTSDDPAWSNAKGYCTITPKSAAVWLRAQAA